MLTRAVLLERLEARRAQERQAFANFNAARGAVIELEQLLLLLPPDEESSSSNSLEEGHAER